MTCEGRGVGSRQKGTFQRKLIFPPRAFSVWGGRVEFPCPSSLPTILSQGSLGSFSNPVWMGFSPCSGGSLCHDNFWWPACGQDGHATGSGPSQCTQVRGVLHGGAGAQPQRHRARGSSLPSGSLGVSDGKCPFRAPPLTRFQVDFQCGCTLYPRPDIAIHFNPRFHTTKPHVICNTLHHGHWQVEARWPNVALQRGDSFLILFLFENEQMKVSGRDGPRVSGACVLPPLLPSAEFSMSP